MLERLDKKLIRLIKTVTKTKFVIYFDILMQFGFKHYINYWHYAFMFQNTFYNIKQSHTFSISQIRLKYFFELFSPIWHLKVHAKKDRKIRPNPDHQI